MSLSLLTPSTPPPSVRVCVWYINEMDSRTFCLCVVCFYMVDACLRLRVFQFLLFCFVYVCLCWSSSLYLCVIFLLHICSCLCVYMCKSVKCYMCLCMCVFTNICVFVLYFVCEFACVSFFLKFKKLCFFITNYI